MKEQKSSSIETKAYTSPPQQPKISVATQTNNSTTATATTAEVNLAPDPPIPPPVSTKNSDTKTTSVPLASSSSSTSSPEKSRSTIKLEKFSGKEQLEPFIRKFKIDSRYNQWTESDKLSHLFCSLSGQAEQILWDRDAELFTTADELIERLRSRFGNAEQTALFQTQLENRRQKESEDMGTLAQDIRRLISLAYPGPSSIHLETLATRAFLNALYDQSLALRVRELEPTSLDSAFKLATRLEAYRKAALDKPGNMNRHPARTQMIKEPDSNLKEVIQRLDRMEKAAKAQIPPLIPGIPPYYPPVCPPYPPPPQWNGNQRNWNENRGRQRTQPAFNQKRRCYICSAETHLQKD